MIDLKRVEALVGPIAASLGFELVCAEWGSDSKGGILRLLIDREGGVTVGDCENLSREVETLLEVERVVPLRYRLEVSSPGLNRPLVREADFIRFAGRRAAVKTREPIEGRRNYKGLLKGVVAGKIVMVVDNQNYEIPVGFVEKAHLVF